MNRKLLGAIASSAAVLAGLLVASPATAAPQTATASSKVEDYVDSPYFTGGRYRSKEICIHQMFTSLAWAPGDIGNALEPAVNTGWRSASQGCAGYPAWQVMRVALYDEIDGHCTKWTGTSNPSSLYTGHPMNEWYNRVWDGAQYPTVWINQRYNETCWDIDFNRNYRLAREMMNVVGLQAYCSYTTGQESPMNSCSNDPNGMEWPGPLDRNRITILMNP